MDEKEKYKQEIARMIKRMDETDIDFIRKLYTLCLKHKRKRGD